MPADIHFGEVVIADKLSVDYRKTKQGYVAFCTDCVDDVGVGWFGEAHIIGYDPAPYLEALFDLDDHLIKFHDDDEEE